MKVKSCAIIIPGFLPVPAVEGGAVEVLAEELINGNELNHVFDFDLYTIPNKKIDKKYKFCKIIQLEYSKLDIIKGYVCKILLRLIKKDGKNSVGAYIYGLKVKKILRKKKYDKILIENNMKIYELLKNKKNIVFHLHNDIFDDSKPKYLCEEIINKCDYVITVSNYLTNRMRSVIDKDNIKTLHNCIDFNIFTPNHFTEVDYVELRKKYKISLNDFVVVYTGRIVSEKGIYELCCAFLKFIKKFPNSKLIIVGSSWFGKEQLSLFEKKIFEIAKELENQIIFTGFVEHNEIPKILYMSDGVVIPSKWEEPFGVVALEAMAMKKTIIATKSGGLTEMLNDKNSILIANDENLIDSIYNAMIKIKMDSSLKENISNTAYNDVRNTVEFDKENYFNLFCKLIGIENQNK